MFQDGVTLGPSTLVEVLAEMLLDEASYSDDSGELIRDEIDDMLVTWHNATDQGRELGRRLARKALEIIGQWNNAPEPTAWIYQGNVLVPLVELPPGFVAIRHDHLEADIKAIVGQPDISTISVSWSKLSGGLEWTNVHIHGVDHGVIAHPDSFGKTAREVWDEAKEQLEAHRKQVADGFQ